MVGKDQPFKHLRATKLTDIVPLKVFVRTTLDGAGYDSYGVATCEGQIFINESLDEEAAKAIVAAINSL